MFEHSRKIRCFYLFAGTLFASLITFAYYAGTLRVSRLCPPLDQPPQQEPHSSMNVHHIQFIPFPNTSALSNRPPTKLTYTGAFVSGENYSEVPFDFRRAVMPDEMMIFLDLLVTLDRITRSNNITMFMNYGTLLGSFRHHALVPWDDDCDVAMPYVSKYTILSALQNAYSLPYSLPELSSTSTDPGGYDVQVTADTQFRFTSLRSRLYRPGWPFRWPYIDIDLYFENQTHVWTLNSDVEYSHRLNVVFPLHLRPLGSIWLLAPHDTHQFMVETFKDIKLCATGMQHKTGLERSTRRLPCESLRRAYPFIHRSLTSERRVLETLKLDDTVLYSIVVDEPVISASVDPFTFSRDSQSKRTIILGQL